MSSTPLITNLSKIEQKTILDLLSKGKRIDGRFLLDFRELKIEYGVIEKANGSAQLSLGKTKVLVGIKVEIGEPFSDTPDEGVLTVNAELVPLASPSFEPGPPDENSIELARVVDRGIRESNAIDLKKLCIFPGKKVFVIFIDIYVLDHDGNLIDASAIASLAALLNAKMKDYEVKNGEIVYKQELIPLPIQNYPIMVTIGKINNELIVDPCLEEEQVMQCRLSIAIDKKDNICAIQKGGLGEFTLEEIKKAVEIAIIKANEIRENVLKMVEKND
ncbi:MAG: exosome complex protein Rrp42 [Candidatus Bathyarchaeia archaeon]